MRKALAVVLCAAALAGAPAVPAYAGPDDCPPEVLAVRGTQPTYAQVDAWLTAAAEAHDVPVSILRVIAYKESTWRQFAADGSPLISSDAVCGVGLMQVTADGRSDAEELASNGAYNALEGAEILRGIYDQNQAATIGPDGYAADDDPDVLENWYYAICHYNGCPKIDEDTYDVSYTESVADLLDDPFRFLPDTTALRAYLRPAGFTKPTEPRQTYVFPQAYQARWTETGGEYVYYDGTNGDVVEVVPVTVHRASAPPVVSYAAHSLGPDGPKVSCVDCVWWRLWEGAGRSGRAHWTNSITGASSQAKVTWAFGVPGHYRVDAFVPALGTETLGRATYAFADGATTTSTTIDQNLVKGGWVTLTQRMFKGNATVTLGDLSDAAGVKLVADAVRIVPVPTLTLQRVTPQTATYGNSVRLYLTLRYAHGDGVAYRYVTLHRRALGTSTWQQVATLRTSDVGAAGTVVRAERNVEYVARFTPSPGDYLVGVSSAVVRQYVAPRVLASLSNATPFSGDATTLRTSVSPVHAGHTVQFQRWVSGTGWRTVAYGRLDASGRSGWTFRPTWGGACGTYGSFRFRVYKPADHDHVAAASAPVDLRVRARC